ncbi:MAG: hypothetical protein ACLPKB_20275 [Xanthobacteraceae bacterium]
MHNAAPEPSPIPRVIRTELEAEQAIAHAAVAMEGLHGLVEQETALVRAGRLSQAARLQARKSELAGLYLTAAVRLKANTNFLVETRPQEYRALRERHETLRAVLQKNLIVLATTHAVAEGIMRRLAGDLTRKAAPQTYGASGRSNCPNPRMARPLAVSRTL